MLGALRNATPSQVGVPSPLQAPVTETRHGVAPKGAKTEENKAAQQKVNIPLPVSETGTGRFGLGGREKPEEIQSPTGRYLH